MRNLLTRSQADSPRSRFSARHAHLHRRQFLKMAGFSAVALGSAATWPARALAGRPAGALPNPIPGGIQPFGAGTTIFHILLPNYPPFGNPDPASNDPATITDFNGHVGLAYVQGMGTHTNKVTGAVRHLPFEVDLRFMRGQYVGLDEVLYHGAFVLN